MSGCWNKLDLSLVAAAFWGKAPVRGFVGDAKPGRAEIDTMEFRRGVLLQIGPRRSA